MRPRTRLLLILMLLLTTAAARADELVLRAPEAMPRGMRFQIELTVEHERTVDSPDFPSVPGLDVIDSSSRQSQQTFILNGRRTTSRRTNFIWTVRLLNDGRIEIPSFPIVVDGTTQHTRPHTIEARSAASPEVTARIESNREQVFVGEAAPVTLVITVQAYVDDEFAVRWTSDDSWNRIQLQESQWGVFVPAMNERMRRNALPPPVTEIERTDDTGALVTYHEFRIDASVLIQRAGPLPFDPIMIVVQYPVRLREQRRLFGRGNALEIAETRPIVAEAEMPTLQARELPTEGQPPFFSGAVGQYEIATSASQRNVVVGDPIDLRVRITDRTAGDRDLETLQPPHLSEVDALTASFQVPAGSLAGNASARTKDFVPTIRARRADVTEIPAIPFAFFNPATASYEVVHSEPIPIRVEPAATMSMDEVVGAAPDSDSDRGKAIERAESGLRANDTIEAMLADARPFTIGPLHAFLAAIGPVLCLAIGARRLRDARQADELGSRRRGAANRARHRLNATSAAEVAPALCDYVADRLGRPAGAMTIADVTTAMRTSGVADELCNEVESIGAASDAARYAAGATSDDSLASSARDIISRLEREELS